MHILVVNPNTTASMTRTIAAAARAAAGPSTVIEAVTSAMGPASIEGYYDEALAVPGLLAEIARGERAGAAAAVIACFDDTGLDAARAMAAIPVIGICEAALSLASFLARRFSVVTMSERSLVPITELVRRYGMEPRARVRALGVPVLDLEDRSSDAVAALRGEITRALKEDHAEAIVLGCAGMADLAAALQGEFGIPVVDGVGAAVKQAEALVTLGLSTGKRGAYARPAPKPYTGLLAGFGIEDKAVA
ncbi:aspartate/glutamate racemase family protein [Chelatococcus sp. XZ-Ab1]|uniref:aspartate/glutamate racemase family protein n=1 Tax=Chelatococcus sp. XZ-Ab1 TaxID=3034027 RepID=UPI0023E3D30F|nr:aspartate/glutamate racemase family protein [Chelatococcus sp. XZ-Ab1]